MAKLKNIHPGEILLEDFLIPIGISQNALARTISVSPRRINEIVGKARHHCRHGAAPVARFWHERGILDGLVGGS